jgi:HD superfamily phosphodiesterase
MKKVILTEEQFNRLVEQSVFHDLSELPTHIESITKDVTEGKKAMGKLIGFLKTINIGNILEEPVKYTKIVQDCSKLYEVYRAKNNKYWDIRDSFEQQEYENDGRYSDEFNKFDHLVNDIDNLQTDLDNLHDMYNDIIEPFIEYGKVNERMSYFEKEYPPETVNIIPIDNNPE